jgi:hypothetical protein
MEPNMAAVETCDGNKVSDIVELDVVEKYCIQQDDQSQSNEGDIKGTVYWRLGICYFAYK